MDSTDEKMTLVGDQNADLYSSNSDRVGGWKDFGVTDERLPVGGGRRHGEAVKSGHVLRMSTSASVRQAKVD